MHQYACVCAVRPQFVMSLLCAPADGDRLERLLQQACFHLDRRRVYMYVCVPAITTMPATILCGFSTHIFSTVEWESFHIQLSVLIMARNHR